MSDSPLHEPALRGAVAFTVVSTVLAAIWVAANDGFGSGDLKAFALWTVALAVPTFLLLRLFDRGSKAWGPTPTYLAAASLGTLGGVALTMLVASLLGHWIAAFSFPVLLCWLAGALAGFVTTALVRRPTTWFHALSAIVLPLVAVFAILEVAVAQPPDLIIHVQADVGPDQIDTLRSEVLGRPAPQGGESHLPGVSAVSRFDGDGEVRIRVVFRPGTRAERRSAVVQRAIDSPLVARTSNLPPTPVGRFRSNYVRHSD